MADSAHSVIQANSALGRLTAPQWLALAGGLMQGHPELTRQFRYLENLLQSPAPETARKLTHQFIGASKCPSASGCERLAARTRWLQAIVAGDLLTDAVRLALLHAGLDKLLPACEGADDRSGLFRPAVRELVQKGLQIITACDWSSEQKVELVFELALADQCTLVEPIWWWNHLLRTDEAHAVRMAAHRIEQLPAIEPSHDRTWKTLGGRWTRLRLKGFLEHARANALLAELLAKSALDDFEAAQAVSLLRETGRGRDALALAERWNRLMPASPVIGEALCALYLDDGWDDEALQLARWHYERDPHARWLPIIEKAAGSAWPDVRANLPVSSKQ